MTEAVNVPANRRAKARSRDRLGRMAGFALSGALVWSAPARADDSGGPDFRSGGVSIYAGYSYRHASAFVLDTFDGETNLGGQVLQSTTGANRSHDMHGAEFSIAVPLSDWVSLSASGTWHTSSSTNEIPGGTYREANNFTILVIPGTSAPVEQTDLSATIGAEFRIPDLKSRLVPFARVQAGIDKSRAGSDNLDQERINLMGGSSSVSITGFTADIGVGVDLPLNDTITLRLLQVDYRYIELGHRSLVEVGDSIDTTIVNLSGGNPVTALQSLEVNVPQRNDFLVSVGIVLHPFH